MLSTLRLDADLECDIVLASYEALANAVEHAYQSGTSPRPWTPRQPTAATIVTSGCGSPIAATGATPPDEKGSHGHGLALIRKLTTDTVVTSSSVGTHVVLVDSVTYEIRMAGWAYYR